MLNKIQVKAKKFCEKYSIDTFNTVKFNALIKLLHNKKIINNEEIKDFLEKEMKYYEKNLH